MDSLEAEINPYRSQGFAFLILSLGTLRGADGAGRCTFLVIFEFGLSPMPMPHPGKSCNSESGATLPTRSWGIYRGMSLCSTLREIPKPQSPRPLQTGGAKRRAEELLLFPPGSTPSSPRSKIPLRVLCLCTHVGRDPLRRHPVPFATFCAQKM